jgi:predicted alpha/beta hydrolase family esterase
MHSHSALARLQQAITLGLSAAALAWLAGHWHASPFVAVFGFAVIVLGYSMFLALEFVALRFVGRDDPAPRATWSELARAWWGETLSAPRVFLWRQPFRWRAVADSLEPSTYGRRGAVFIHGFVCNRGFWTPWLERMRLQGRAFVAVNLEPAFGTIDDYAEIIDNAVQRVAQVTGMPPVLVCHSMGGLAARAWLRAADNASRVDHVITIGTPHHGTWLGRFSHLTNGQQMRIGSAWITELGESKSPVPFTCWYSNCDNVVFPASTATLPGADNRLVRGVAHVHLAFQPQVMADSLGIVGAQG